MSGSPRNQDLGFTPSIFGAGAGIFFIGYLLLALTLATIVAAERQISRASDSEVA